jgi:Flp pilus assembly protein TadG
MSRPKSAGSRGRRTLRAPLLDEEGSSLVETALACSILMAMLVGIFDLSLAAYTAHSLSETAREATRYAIVRGANCVNLSGCKASNTEIQAYVRSIKYPGIRAAQLTTTTTWYNVSMDTTKTPNTAVVAKCGTSPNGCNMPGNQVQVLVSYPFSFNIPFFGTRTLTLTSSSAMVISQ